MKQTSYRVHSPIASPSGSTTIHRQNSSSFLEPKLIEREGGGRRKKRSQGTRQRGWLAPLLLEERNKLAPLSPRKNYFQGRFRRHYFRSVCSRLDKTNVGPWRRKKINRDDAERDDRREMEEKERKEKEKKMRIGGGRVEGRKENPPGN